MSMKRSKQRSFGQKRWGEDEASGFGKPPEPEKSWEQHVTGQAPEAFVPYSTKTLFAKGTLIEHPKFGKGVVVRVEGTHAEVLFAEGKKTLAHGLG